MEEIKKELISVAQQSKICTSNKTVVETKFSSDVYKNSEEYQKYTMLKYEKLLNNKKKFSLDNHFDRKNSKQFLVEKDKYLSEMIIEDEPSKKEDSSYIEKSKTVDDLNNSVSVPSSMNKFTFGGGV